MKKIKVLNLYAGIGGNRKLWRNVEVTAVENNKDILDVYQKLFPEDNIILGDAHKYLLEHFKEFNFIWSSPPCPTHSRTNNFLHAQGHIRYPDMKLYEEIVFLKSFFKGKWVVENVVSYYEPLIKPCLLDRHYFWSNFIIGNFTTKRNFNIANARSTTRKDVRDYENCLEKYHHIDLSDFKIKKKRLLLRNCVYPPLGLHIFKCAFKIKQEVLTL